MISSPEQKYLDKKKELLVLHILDYKKMVSRYLSEGIRHYDFDNDTKTSYEDELEKFNTDNSVYIDLLKIFNQLMRRYAKNSFNTSIKSEGFTDALLNTKLSEPAFVTYYATQKAIEEMMQVHRSNKNNTELIFSIFYNDDLKKKINILDLPIYRDEDYNEINRINIKLTNILHPKPKKQELYPLSLFGVKLTVREVATLIIFMKSHYNIKPDKKSDLLEIAYLVFGDINLELKLNTPTNNSALYDFITYGKGLFVDDKYDYSTAKSKIINALGYEETTKFKRFKSYIKKHDLKGFKSLIKEK